MTIPEEYKLVRHMGGDSRREVNGSDIKARSEERRQVSRTQVGGEKKKEAETTKRSAKSLIFLIPANFPGQPKWSADKRQGERSRNPPQI